MCILKKFIYIKFVFLPYSRIPFIHFYSFLFVLSTLYLYIFGHILLLFCIRHLVIRSNMVQYVQLKIRGDGTKPNRTANKAILLSESFGKILDISTVKMIPLDLRGTKIHNLKATLRLIFHRKLFKSLKLTKLKFLCQFINF